MAGHSKWNNIKHRKAASDSKKGKVFTKHAKFITLAAKQGGDANMNPLLRAAIDAAKAENVPNDNIDRAIKKGTGELKDDTVIEECFYDAFGPGGVAILIHVLTDNKNRSVTNVKKILNKRGGRFADAGSVAWMFKKKGLIRCQGDAEAVTLEAIDAGAEDVLEEDGLISVYTAPEDLMKIRSALSGVESAELIYDADTKVTLRADSAEFAQLQNLIDALEEDEDVAEVFLNAEIED